MMNYLSICTNILLFVVAFIFPNRISAQSVWSIKGEVKDAVSGNPLHYSTISILRAKDSTLVKFTRTSEKGSFSVSGKDKDKMLVLITYNNYAEHTIQFSPDETEHAFDFGVIQLFRKEKLLEEVIIKGKAAAIKIKKDTTEFNASSYQIKPNSKVEDLLKQLPGIQVDQDGKITAEGKRINRVLVDGEEFFGDDPTLVTKNIRGDMVSKVQLYDKKSDQTEFTGIADGKKEKTINIKLKEDAKNGYFGQLEASGGTRKFYNNRAMINYFKRKQKLSVYGILSNTGKISLGWEDNQKYGSADDIQFDEAGRGSMIPDDENGLDAQSGQYSGEGIPRVKSGGIHYDTKWNNNKESINLNYKIGSITIDGLKNTLVQNNLLSGIISSNSDQSFSNSTSRQKLDATYQVKPDSTSTIKIALAGTSKKISNEQSFSGNVFFQNQLLNKNLRSISGNGTDHSLTANIFLTKRLEKAGRTLSLYLKQAFNENKTSGYLYSHNEFWGSNDKPDSLQIVDQYRNNMFKSTEFSGNLTYTEPLTSSLALVLSYVYGLNNSNADRKILNRSADGVYDNLDKGYSSHYQLNQSLNTGSAFINWQKGKTTINIGTKIISMNFDQTDLLQNSSFRRNFTNWNPQAEISYQLSPQKQLNFNYTRTTIRPTFDQIQPVRINNDPLNIITGNPSLEPSSNHGINISYNSYKTLNEQSIYLSGAVNMISNPIVNNVEVDAVGKSGYRWVNLKNKKMFSYTINASYVQKLKSTGGINGGFSLGTTGNTSYNHVNNILNKTQSNTYFVNLRLSSFKYEAFQGMIDFGPTYTKSQSSLQKQMNNNGWGLNGNAFFSIKLPWKFEISSNARYEYREKTASFNSNFSVFILNAEISKKILKSESLKFTLSANDLLNQNIGFNRNINGSTINQTNFTMIKRYFMASLIWDFSKMGSSAP